jgi:Cu-Zn family superoxide dismutase
LPFDNSPEKYAPQTANVLLTPRLQYNRPITHTGSCIMHIRSIFIAVSLACSLSALAEEQYVIVHAISDDGIGAIIGTVKLSDSEKGLLVDPDIGGLTPGTHGFHVHEKPDCAPADKDGKRTAGHAAGGHFDPHKAGKHSGPHGDGHMGDLPALEVNENGEAVRTMLVPRLKLSEIKGRALMIHAGSDNYSDTPKPLGGGGPRMACGIIE